MRHEHAISVRRLAKAFAEPPSSIERWLRREARPSSGRGRKRPVRDEPSLRQRVRDLADQPRHRTLGYRRIWALLRREGLSINAKTVRRMMRDLGLSRPKLAYKARRPKRVEKMRPQRPNQGWQIDMTSFILSDLTPLFLVTVVDCCTRELVGWTLDRRSRAGEWTAAVRMALEARQLMEPAACRELGLVLRSDNGSQPCSKTFVEFLGAHGITGQYTGYNAPDDNAYVERIIRTIKEEEIWPNLWDTLGEARQAMEAYVTYYNHERLHSALNYRTPAEVAAAFITRAAA
jgi:putative transposase